MRWSVMKKNWFTIFNVKVTARAYITKIWLFLLCLLNFWSVCRQTWFNGITSEAEVSSGKTGLQCSRSQWRFKMLVDVCPDDIFWTISLLSNLAWLCSIISQCHTEKLVHCLQCHGHTPQWGAADAEIKVPSGENTELKRSPFKAWSRSIYSHTC